MEENSNKESITESRLKSLPKAPGVYLMKDASGETIYIGKAKNLRRRVRDYFRGRDERHNVKFLLARVASIDTVVAESERQAIILEADLIKKYKPRYNIRLKDDKAHLIVRIDFNHEWPKLELVRRRMDDGARYIGPFSFSYEIRSVLETIKRTLPLRTCSDSVLYNRVRPCLEHQIKRCAAPCCLEVDPMEYREWLEQAVEILQGNNKQVIAHLRERMNKASEELRYEDAALYRDRIEIIKRVSEENSLVQFADGSRDALAIVREGSNVEATFVIVRSGRIVGSKTFGFEDVEISDDELLSGILSQYYLEGGEFPDEILLDFLPDGADAQAAVFSEKKGTAVYFKAPKRGPKARLLSIARTNAEENFNVRFAQAIEHERVLREFQTMFSLDEVPRVIECVDVSHFQGGNTVGSLVCFFDGRKKKARYRHFHLSQEGKADDFASMREMISRHLSRCVEENTLPDLIIVDGGKAQLSQAVQVRNEISGSRPQMIGLAKKRTIKTPYRMHQEVYSRGRSFKPERVFLEGADTSIAVPVESDVLRLLERIRDEAHRFAVSFHRTVRTKQTFQSDLDLIAGVGPKRKKLLLATFGSIEGIKNASLEDLVNRANIPEALAKKILMSL